LLDLYFTLNFNQKIEKLPQMIFLVFTIFKVQIQRLSSISFFFFFFFVFVFLPLNV